MKDLSKVIKKYLQSQIWVFDGTKFKIENVETMDSYLSMDIEVELEKPGQSYLRNYFRGCIIEVLRTLSEAMMYTIPWRATFFVDGEPCDEIYVSAEKVRELKNYFNTPKREIIMVPETKYSPKKNISKDNLMLIEMVFGFQPNKEWIEENNGEITFNLYSDVTIVKALGVRNPRIKKTTLSKLKGLIVDHLSESDFQMNMSDDIYGMMKDEWKLNHTEDYIVANVKFRTINGENVLNVRADENVLGELPSNSLKYLFDDLN